MSDATLAQNLAMKFHAGQKYGEMGYDYHLRAVAQSVRRAFPGDERLIIIAWLHDILEDTLCRPEILYALFPDEIVTAVVALTKLKEESREDYLARVKKNELAAKVKFHDAWCNMQESFDRNHTRRIRKYAETILALTS